MDHGELKYFTKGQDMITGAQVRMARAFLRWSVAELAEKAAVGISTVKRIEESAELEPANVSDLGGADKWRALARDDSVKAVHGALVKAGITFLPDDGKGCGVRGKAKPKR